MLSHSSYENAKNNLILYYDLYNENLDQNELLFRELRRYNQFPLIINKDRIITYTKICYKVKYDTSNIIFVAHIQATQKNGFSYKSLYNQTWSKLYFCKTLWEIKKLLPSKIIMTIID